MSQRSRAYPVWVRDIFGSPIWHQRPVFRSTSVPLSEERAVTSQHSCPPSPRSLPDPPDERELILHSDWRIQVETMCDATADPLDSTPSSPRSELLSDLKYWDWLCFRELLGDPYWTHRGWVCLCALQLFLRNANNCFRKKSVTSNKRSFKQTPADLRPH